jgi:hypothetical protein
VNGGGAVDTTFDSHLPALPILRHPASVAPKVAVTVSHQPVVVRLPASDRDPSSVIPRFQLEIDVFRQPPDFLIGADRPPRVAGLVV